MAGLSRGVVLLNNLNTSILDTDYVQSTLSEDPSGFIYSTYSAAEGQIQEDKPIIEEANQGYAYLSSAVGGSLSQLSFEDSGTKNRISITRGRGTKGKVRGFSRVSRRNLLRRFASINRSAFRAYKGRVFALTLTYPSEYPENSQLCKRNLKALYKRLTRRFGDFAGYWRMGIQKRGAWHFHLLLFMPPSSGVLKELRRFVSSSWYEICGKVGEGHLLAGTRVEEIRNWRKVTSYAERYMAKEEKFPEGVETGRIWGAWNEELLPVKWETVKVSLKDAFRIRRIYRRLAKRRGTGSLRRLTVFIRHENMLRLLEFLGYRQEE